MFAIIACPATAQEETTAPQESAAAAPAASGVEQELDAIFGAPEWNNARWGVMVADLGTSQLLYQRDAGKSFMPASNMKLYTTAAALEQLGPDFRYETHIYATGTTDSRGTLRGDIVIVGSGDPSISGRYLEDQTTTGVLREWAQAIKDADIRRIEGQVIGDDDVFDDSFHAGSWQLNYYQDWYAAESSGLAMNDNCWDVVIKPGAKEGAPAKLESPIPGSYVKFVNNVKTSKPRPGRATPSGATGTTATAAVADQMSTATASTTASYSSDPPIEISRGLADNEVVLSGTIPQDYGDFKEWGSLHNGTLFAATLLEEELERQNVRVTKDAADIDDVPAEKVSKLKADRGKRVHTHVSPPLSKIIAIINKPSQNFYADQLLKTLGAQSGGRGSFSAGRRVVQDFLTTAGVNASSLQMVDGSGLSRQDMVEPQMTLALLQHMAKSSNAQVFEESLPVMGVDGTLKTRLRDTPAHKNVKAKTGTIGGVRSLSGYLTTTDGKRYAFVMMANNFTQPTKAATEAQDEALLKLIDGEGQ